MLYTIYYILYHNNKPKIKNILYAYIAVADYRDVCVAETFLQTHTQTSYAKATYSNLNIELRTRTQDSFSTTQPAEVVQPKVVF